MHRVIVVMGPTASGKSDFAVALAKHLILHRKDYGITGAEIISADSRQVYKGLTIGSGKITSREMRGIVHHMLDVISPTRTYTVARYQKTGRKILEKILSQKKIAIVCGGTGLYIDALLKNVQFPPVPPDTKLRTKLEKIETKDLFSLLKKIDLRRARHIDKHNRPRLIRAIEIASHIGASPQLQKQNLIYKTLFLGINPPDSILFTRIEKRLRKRLRAGMTQEVKTLHDTGVSWDRLERLGLEYRYVSRYLRGMLTKKELHNELYAEIKKYAKRQRTWFKRNTKIHWMPPQTSIPEMIALTRHHLTG